MNEGMNYFWSTPIFKSTIKNKILLNDIINYILLKENNTDNNLPIDKISIFDDPFFNSFISEEILPAFETYFKKELNISLDNQNFSLNGWINGVDNKFQMPTHNHKGSHISAVFYLLTEEEKGGSLIINDPRFNSNRGYREIFNKWFESLYFKPKTGDIVMFPSFLYHGVQSFFGSVRLSMPVDLTIHGVKDKTELNIKNNE